MAKVDIKKMRKIDRERYMVQDEVPATYVVFEKYGKKYFQIDTYGRSDRVETEKASQIIQIDETSAKELIKLLVKEFEIL